MSDTAEKVVAELRAKATRLEKTFKLAPPLTLVEADVMREAAALIESQRAELAKVKTEAQHVVMSLIFMPGVRTALDNLPADDPVEPYLKRIRELEAAEARVTALEAEKAGLVKAVSAVTDATSAYLPPGGISKDECLNRVLAATDNPKINAIMLGATNGRS